MIDAATILWTQICLSLKSITRMTTPWNQFEIMSLGGIAIGAMGYCNFITEHAHNLGATADHPELGERN
jgi:hypothetical protein